MKGKALRIASLYKEYTSDSNLSIIITDTNNTINYTNENFCQLVESTKKDILGQNIAILQLKNQSLEYLSTINQILNNGDIWNDSVEFKNKHDENICMDRTIIPLLDDKKKIELCVTTYQKLSANDELENSSFTIDKNSIIAKTDETGTITYVNDNFCEISGYTREELTGKNHRLLNSGNQSKTYWKNMYRTLFEGNIWQDEVKNKRKDGTYYWVDTTVIPYIGKDNIPESFISIRTNITEQKKISGELASYKIAMDQHAIIATTDLNGTITYVNDKFLNVSGYTKNELIGQNHRILNSGNQPKSYWENMYKSVSMGNIWKDQVQNISKNGSYYWVETSIIPIMDDFGKIDSYFSIRTDITYQKRVEKILSTQRFAMDQHSIIAITDIKGSITYVNDKFCNISGYTENELIGKNHRILNSHSKDTKYWKSMYQNLKEKGVWQDEIKNISKNGEFYWVDTTIVPILDSQGKTDCYISIRTDITKYKKTHEELENYKNNLEKVVQERTIELAQANEKLKELSEIDSLTNLYNRRKLEIDFEQEIERARRYNHKMALYFIDLDKFKNVNDIYGHTIGDELLKEISSRIIELLRKNEYLYRIGGDEFCILIPEFYKKEELIIIANRVINLISNIKSIDSYDIDIGCSIGISIYPENGDSLEELILEADESMYNVKKSGRNNYCFT